MGMKIIHDPNAEARRKAEIAAASADSLAEIRAKQAEQGEKLDALAKHVGVSFEGTSTKPDTSGK